MTDAEQKTQIIEALQKHKRVDLAAQDSGIHVRQFYRMMKKHGIRLKAVLAWPSMPQSESVPESEVPTPEPTVDPGEPKPGHTAKDYSGANLGDVGRRAADPSDLLSRWERLKRN